MGEWGGYPPPPPGPPRSSSGSADNGNSNKSNVNDINAEDHENGNESKPPSRSPNSQHNRDHERQPDHVGYPDREHDSSLQWGGPPGASDYGRRNNADRQTNDGSHNERNGSSSS